MHLVEFSSVVENHGYRDKWRIQRIIPIQSFVSFCVSFYLKRVHLSDYLFMVIYFECGTTILLKISFIAVI